MRFSAKRVNDFGKIRYRASLLSLKPTIPKSVPLSLFRIVITRVFLICDWRWRSAEGFCHSVYTCGSPHFSIIWEKRAVLILRSFIGNHWIDAGGATPLKKKPARELRQGGSYYRCCIPALAGFVSPQSIAPDGGEISSHQKDAQLKNSAAYQCYGLRLSMNASRIDSALRFCLHRAREMADVSLGWFCFGCSDILHNACQPA